MHEEFAMTIRKPIALLLCGLIAAAPACARALPPGVQAEARTEAAVREASDDWLAAERRGDVAALDRRVMPEYRDIEPDGRAHFRPGMLAYAAHLKEPSTVPAKQLAAEFRKAHPAL